MMDELVKVLHPLIKQFMPFAQERMGFDNYINADFIDTFRIFNQSWAFPLALYPYL